MKKKCVFYLSFIHETRELCYNKDELWKATNVKWYSFICLVRNIFTPSNTNPCFLEVVYFKPHLFQLVLDPLPLISFYESIYTYILTKFYLNYFFQF